MFSSASPALLWRGLLAVAIGIVSVAWPNITVGAFVILFAVYAFIAAGSDTARAFSSDRVGPVAGYLFLALLSFAAGLVALLWPGLTALVLTLCITAWALVTGIMEVILAFWQGEAVGERAMWALGGLVSIALGVVLALRPDIGALSLATVFGVALFLAIGLEPAVSVLARRWLPRWAAVLTVTVLVLAVVAGFLATAIPPLVREAGQFVTQAPTLVARLQSHQSVLGLWRAKTHHR
jgi:uncharacterized membrane protein HdeD (DUF308 family)